MDVTVVIRSKLWATVGKVHEHVPALYAGTRHTGTRHGLWHDSSIPIGFQHRANGHLSHFWTTLL